MLKTHPLDADLVVDASLEPVEVAPAIQRRIDAIWAADQARRRTPMHDGRLFSLSRRTDARWTGSLVPYRWFVAQLRDPELFEALQVRPVAISGVLACADGLVFGRRSSDATQFPGWWELTPSGGLDDACRRPDATIDYVAKALEELVEETGCPAASMICATPFAAIEDTATRSIDLAIALTTRLSGPELQRCHLSADGEYQELAIVRPDDIRAFADRHAADLVEISRALLIELDHL